MSRRAPLVPDPFQCVAVDRRRVRPGGRIDPRARRDALGHGVHHPGVVRVATGPEPGELLPGPPAVQLDAVGHPSAEAELVVADRPRPVLERPASVVGPPPPVGVGDHAVQSGELDDDDVAHRLLLPRRGGLCRAASSPTPTANGARTHRSPAEDFGGRGDVGSRTCWSVDENRTVTSRTTSGTRPSGGSCWRTATGCSARSTRPRTWSRRRCCGRGGRPTGTTRSGRRCGRGCTGSPPTPASQRCRDGRAGRCPAESARPATTRRCPWCRGLDLPWLQPFPDTLLGDPRPRRPPSSAPAYGWPWSPRCNYSPRANARRSCCGRSSSFRPPTSPRPWTPPWPR